MLARAISEAVRGRPLDEITPYEALMRGFGYHFHLDPEEHAEAREALEQAVEQAPSQCRLLGDVGVGLLTRIRPRLQSEAGSLDRALDAARSAVDLAPSNHLAQQVLAVVLFFRKETEGCLTAAERALALNPLDGSNEAIFPHRFFGRLGTWLRAHPQAMKLEPPSPRLVQIGPRRDEYRRENYRAAVDEA